MEDPAYTVADLFGFIQIKGLLSASPAYPPEKEEGERKCKVAQARRGVQMAAAEAEKMLC